MITNSELEISKKSYTNKDFPSIWLEIVNICKKLSYKYDPTESNESDPFVVLLKIIAFALDKLNYNVDKNTLERFMVSATQESSMRELCDMLGYHMEYYNASETDVVFRIMTSYLEDFNNNIVLPAGTVVSNSDGSIQFVTISPTTINKLTGESSSVGVIQGVKKSLTILDSDTILLENIDENNRIYFPEPGVAENGVFITGGTVVGSWTKKNNLNICSYNSNVYKFGYDSQRELPYIEFPEWINNLIGAGLKIEYMATDGANGNVASKLITKVKSAHPYVVGDSETEVLTENLDAFTVSNTVGAVSGSDPESIEEAYQGYKRTRGTFDTLVTCRDYENAIYNLLDDNNNPYVSNVTVADRRTDLNYGCSVVTADIFGVRTVSVPSSAIDAFDLCIYPLKPLLNNSVESISEGENGYDDSFNSLISTSSVNEIRNYLEESASASHNYKGFTTGDILAIKNNYKLNVIISTTYKVGIIEQQSIIDNVKKALVNKFNAREVEFGQALPYDSLLETIENADERIKSVSLSEPEITPTASVVTSTGPLAFTEQSLKNSANTVNEWYKKVVAKNVLAGRVELFDYNEDFNISYDLKNETTGTSSPIIENVDHITSDIGLSAISSSTPLVLKKNEVIQLIYPNLITDAIYPYGDTYYLQLNNSVESIKANVEYSLKSGEYCIVRYEDSEGKTINTLYEQGDILKPNFDWYTTAYISSNKPGSIIETVAISDMPDDIRTKLSSMTNVSFIMFKAKEQVEKRSVLQAELNSSQYCYWHLNNSDNAVSWNDLSNGFSEYVLNDNEYIFYTKSKNSYLFAYGSGTLIRVPTSFKTTISSMPKLKDITKLFNNGVNEFFNSFKYINFSDTNKLTLIEESIVTLTEGDTIGVNDETSLTINSNTFEDIVSDSLYYKLANDTTESTLPSYNGADLRWKARALLDINAGPSLIQYLLKDSYREHTIKLYSAGTLLKTITASESKNLGIMLNNLTQCGGGENVDIRYISVNNLQETSPSAVVFEDINDSSVLTKISSDRYKINFSADSESSSNSVTFSTLSNCGNKIMYIYADGASGATISISNTSGDGMINYSQVDDDYTDDKYTINLINGVNIILLKSAISSFTITRLADDVSVQLGNIHLINDELNSHLDITGSDLFNYIKSKLGNEFKKFYATHEPDLSKQIELSKDYSLSSAQAFFDVNNVANKWTISKIDFKNSVITIARSSKK